MSPLLPRFRNSERGAALIEYALLIILLILVAAPALSYFGREVDNTYKDLGRAMNQRGLTAAIGGAR